MGRISTTNAITTNKTEASERRPPTAAQQTSVARPGSNRDDDAPGNRDQKRPHDPVAECQHHRDQPDAHRCFHGPVDMGGLAEVFALIHVHPLTLLKPLPSAGHGTSAAASTRSLPLDLRVDALGIAALEFIVVCQVAELGLIDAANFFDAPTSFHQVDDGLAQKHQIVVAVGCRLGQRRPDRRDLGRRSRAPAPPRPRMPRSSFDVLIGDRCPASGPCRRYRR